MNESPATLHATDQSEGVKDTIEQFVIAFILAFVFRGFLVEAFIIPTGSMAPTLHGMHGTQICPDCGWEFAYNMPGDAHEEVGQIKCPNCQRESASHAEIPYHYAFCHLKKERKRSVDSLEGRRIDAISFLPRSGDRILVFKWTYDAGGKLLGPSPWEVVVFKNPVDGENNYIKRLVGMPNEVLEILDGDIYTCSTEGLDPGALRLVEEMTEHKHALNKSSFETPARLSGQFQLLQSRVVESLSDRLKIRRKTETAQASLWHNVFHQDYLPPPDIRELRPRWEPDEEGAWNTSAPKIKFSGLGADLQSIRFEGKSITDFYAYNHMTRTSAPAENIVGDLRIRFVLVYKAGQGSLRLHLQKNDDRFVAELRPNGEVVLRHIASKGHRADEFIVASANMGPWRVDHPIQIEFGNLDYRVYLKANGAARPVLVTDDEDYAPEINRLRDGSLRRRSGAEIEAEHLDLELWHLALDRDVYYSSNDRRGVVGWGTEGNPIYLRPGEYFVLGDNSPQSQDSRMWRAAGPHLQYRDSGYQVGTVPQDQLIGNAFFVYWPSGHRINWLPVLNHFGLIPNVGKMRWIR